MPMRRPGWVTFVGVRLYIGGALALLFGVLFLLGGSFVAAAFGAVGGLFAALFAVLAFLLIASGILDLVLAPNLLKGRGWARTGALVLAFVGLAFGALSLLVGNFGAVLSIALDILTVVALFQPESKAFFQASGAG